MDDFSETTLTIARSNAAVFEHLSACRYQEAQVAAERLLAAAQALLRFAIARTPSIAETRGHRNPT